MLFEKNRETGSFLFAIKQEGGNRMAGRIQGITVEIGGDTTKLQTALIL